jgi:hypothetical protein
MPYQLFDNGASILINGTSDVLLMKHHVTAVTVIGNNLVRIAGATPLQGIILDYRNVAQPVCNSALSLAINISGMVTSCICGSGNGGGG